MLFAAAVTYVSAQAFGAAGDASGAEFLSAEHLKTTLAHGVVGGVTSEVSGGHFRDGFLAAGAAQFAAPGVGRITTRTGRVMAAAAVGGTASKLGGGKFANGAITAAFARLYGETYREWQRGRTYASVEEFKAGLAGGKAVIGARPLEKLGFGRFLGMVRNAFLDVNNVEVLHEQLFWLEGGELENAGFFQNGVKPDSGFSDNLSLYRFEQPFVPSQPVQPFVRSLGSIFNASTYRFRSCNCQHFMDAVRTGLR